VSTAWLNGLLRDVRFSARALRRTPGFTAAAVATLALGVGTNAAIFSVVDAVVWRSARAAGSERLVQVFDRYEGGSFEGALSFPSFLDYSFATVFARYGALFPERLFHLRGDAPEEVRGIHLGSELFDVIGARPQLGRALTAAEDADPDARGVLISDGFWRSRLGADPAVLGRSLRFQSYRPGHRGEPRGWHEIELTVVGVLDPGFALPPVEAGAGLRAYQPDVVLPFGLRTWGFGNRGMYGLVVLGLLRDEVSLEQAADRLAAIAQGAKEADPSSPVVGVDLVRLPHLVRDRYWAGLRLLWGGAVFLLLIGVANLASLLLARGAARADEIAVCRALGATRWRIARSLLAEAALIGLLGAGVGLAVAEVAIRALIVGMPGRPLGLEQARLDARAFGFALALAVVAVALASLAPALRASRSAITAAIADGGRSSRQGAATMRLLIVGEVASAFVLLAGAGLMVASFRNLVRIDPGVDREAVLVARFETVPYGTKYASARRHVDLVDEIAHALLALPGVNAVGAVDRAPLAATGRLGSAEVTPADRPPAPADEEHEATWSFVTPGAFEALGIRVVAGRTFDAADREAALLALERAPSGGSTPEQMVALRAQRIVPVVVSESLVSRYWPGRSGLGEIFFWGRQDPRRIDDATSWDRRYPTPVSLRIVGVVEDVKVGGLLERPVPHFYTLGDRALREFVVRTEGSPEELIEAVRTAILTVDRAELSVPFTDTMAQRFARASAETRSQMLLVVALASASLLLAAIGMSGVLAHQLARRRWEIGVRKALGARRVHVTGLVLRQGLVPVLAGIVLGLVGALGLTRWMAGWLVAVSPVDPGVLAVSAPLMLALPLLVCALSASWANRLDPSRILRSE
jgi:putative ABC transport system permease protein